MRPILGNESDTGTPIQDVLDVKRALVGYGELELRASHVDPLGYRHGRPLAARGGDHMP